MFRSGLDIFAEGIAMVFDSGDGVDSVFCDLEDGQGWPR